MSGSCVLIHIPHCGNYIPQEIKEGFLISDEDLHKEVRLLTDPHLPTIYEDLPFEMIVNNYSRLVFDSQRLRDDHFEEMARIGRGAIYSKTIDGKTLRNLTYKTRHYLIEKYYDPYRLSLESKIDKLLSIHGKCLLIDVQSFTPYPLPIDLAVNPRRPHICLGTDLVHTPIPLQNFSYEYFLTRGLNVRLNSPFNGVVVPSKYYKKDKRLSAIKLEINKKLYEENQCDVSQEIEETKRLVENYIFELVKIWNSI